MTPSHDMASAGTDWTPGPWRVETAVNGNWIEAGFAVAPISIGRTFYDRVGASVEDANARLMAAAPDLAKAIQPIAQIANQFDGVPSPKYFGDTDGDLRYPDEQVITITLGQCRAARAALAKARGK